MFCMTRAMIVRRDQWRTLGSRATSHGRRASWPPNFSQRGAGPPPSTSSVRSRAIALEPGPYRVGSMWVCSSGWNDEVMATPCV